MFLSKSWKRIHNEQTIGRLARPDADGSAAKQVNVLEVLSEGSIEEWKQTALGEKDETFEDVMQDGDTLRAMLEWTA